MKKKVESPEFSVSCGSIKDDLQQLKALCESEADKLVNNLSNEDASEWKIPFWTEDFPELICVGTFKKDTDGTIKYKLDFEQSTL